MQSVPIINEVVSSNPAHAEVYSIQNYVIKFVSECHDKTEIMLKVALKKTKQAKKTKDFSFFFRTS